MSAWVWEEYGGFVASGNASGKAMPREPVGESK
jgi:hypothetical protein